jgi:nicotinamidase-related amidase
MKALVVIDMLNDFVTGVFESSDAQKIVPNIVESLKIARSKQIPIIYMCTRLEEGDKLIKLWGIHAIKGTEEAEIIPQLKPDKNDMIVYKKLYSGFYDEKFTSFLKDLKIDTLIFTGLYTDICVLNNVASAFHLGYNTSVVLDCTVSTDGGYELVCPYMRNLYDTKIITNDSLALYIEKG